MQWLAELCIKRPVFATVLSLVIMVVGGVFYTKLGVDQFPKIEFPVIIVSTTLPGASPEDVETEITDKLEGAVNTINGLDELRSNSSEGFSQLMIQFVLEKNVDVAAQEVQQKVNTVLAELPRGVDPPIVMKFDPDSIPIAFIALNAPKGRDIREITDLADRVVRRRLESLSGVGQVLLIGGRKRTIDVQVDPIKLKALGIAPAEVARAIDAQNMTLPGGRLDSSKDFLTLRVNGRVRSIDELKAIVVKEQSGLIIRLDQIASVTDGVEDVSTAAEWNGEPTVLLALRKQSGTNTIAVADALKERLGEIGKELPAGYSLAIQRDTSEVVRTAVNAVTEHLILGAILAALVVLVFLGNVRSTVIAAIAIPTSIVGTFALMRLQDYTLNSITLLALALAVGIVIDDAIVVLEIIFRHVEKGVSPRQAAIDGTREIGTAVLATTLSLIAVFLPIAFIGGIPGRFLASFGVTMSFAIAVSLFVSFTMTPMLASRWLKAKDRGDHRKTVLERLVDIGYRPVERLYGGVLAFCLRHRWVVVIVSLASIGACFPMAKVARKGFLPVDDRAQFEVLVRLPEGSSVASSQVIGARVARIIRETPEVIATMVTVGDDPAKTPNQARLYVKLSPPDQRKRSQAEIKDLVRNKILPTLPPELRVTVADVNDFGGGQATQRIQYVIAGPDLTVLEEATRHVMPKIKAIPGAVDVDSSLVAGKPELTINIDRNRAADLGVQVSDVAQALQLLVAGQKVSNYEEGGEQYDVRLRATQQYRTQEDMLQLITVPSRKLGLVSLSDVVTLGRSESLSTISRFQRERQLAVMANAGPGGSEAEIGDAVKKILEDEPLPPGFKIKPQGQTKLLKETALSFVFGLLASLLFMYLILAAQFESWLHPITILIALPLTLPFAVASILLFDQALDMYSFLGIFVLFGVVKKNGILQIAHTNFLRETTKLTRLEAILQANKDRLRPILMTTFAFVAGMIPLLTSHGIGAGFNRATAGVVVGGQLFSLVLTLVAVPVTYSFFDDVSIFFWRLIGREKKPAPRERKMTEPIEGEVAK